MSTHIANLKTQILELANGEPIEAVVIGNMGWDDYGIEEIPAESRDESNWDKVISWEKAAPLLDYDYDPGYGAPGCQAIVVWTPNKVMFVSQYDGATSLEYVPRHPIGHKPNMPGG